MERVAYYVAESQPGDANPPFVDIPTLQISEYAVVVQVEAYVRTADGRRNIDAKDVIVSRYARNIPIADRNSNNRLTEFRIPVSGPRQKLVDYNRENKTYTEVFGLDAIAGIGFRVELSDKDRPADYQRISIGVQRLDVADL